MKYESCPYCGAEADKQEPVHVTVPAIGYAVACLTCKALGPVKRNANEAREAFRTRSANAVIKLDEDCFAIAFGYDKFLLTLEQVKVWREVERKTLLDRVGEKRRLLQDWELLPPSKYVSAQRSF